MFVKYCLPVPVSYFWRKLLHTLQRGLSAIAEHLVIYSNTATRLATNLWRYLCASL